MKSTFTTAARAVATGEFVLAAAPALARDDCGDAPEAEHHLIPANAETVPWGYFSKTRAPQASVHSGDIVTLETLTHHANDGASLMVDGDPESVSAWTADEKGVDPRGAGPMDATSSLIPGSAAPCSGSPYSAGSSVSAPHSSSAGCCCAEPMPAGSRRGERC